MSAVTSILARVMGRGNDPEPSPAPPRERPRGLVEQSDIIHELEVGCDAVVVGSGAGGATVAATLAEAGLDVVMIEEGGYHPTESFSSDAARALRTLYRDAGA